MVRWIIDLALSVLWWCVDFAIDFAKHHPVVIVLTAVGIARMFGTTVQTGWAGVLFSFGRAKKVLQPGFHPLLPIVQAVRKTPIRSITLDLPRQRVTTADDLVYDAVATIVYRVEDSIQAMTAVQDVRQGVLTLVPLLVHELLREQTGQSLANRPHLDAELTARARQALARWGLTVEQAGMSTIAPSRRTVRLTQLSARAGERARLLREHCDSGLVPGLATALVAPGPAPPGR
jgi:regulator of protease activity HflC (stomatin/prohibitin superfamily)